MKITNDREEDIDIPQGVEMNGPLWMELSYPLLLNHITQMDKASAWRSLSYTSLTPIQRLGLMRSAHHITEQEYLNQEISFD